MDTLTRRKLILLDSIISKCEDCSLYHHGRCKPFWTSGYQGLMIIGESPGQNEVRKNIPFIGISGDILWKVMKEYGINKNMCAIINSVNCRPVVYGRNGNPNPEQKETCYKWIRRYIKILQPEKILMLGSYALNTMTDVNDGIVKYNGLQWHSMEYDIQMISSVHPAYCIYNPDDGMPLLHESIRNFAKL